MPTAPAHFTLRVRVQPRARRSRIAGRHGAAIKVQVIAPPVDGAANAELIELLAETLGVARRAIRIVHGTSGRDKVVEIASNEPAACQRRLDEALGLPCAVGLDDAGDGCVDKTGGRE